MYSKEFQNYHLGPYSFDCSYVIVEGFVITCFADDHAPYCGGETTENVIKSLEYLSVFFRVFCVRFSFRGFPQMKWNEIQISATCYLLTKRSQQTFKTYKKSVCLDNVCLTRRFFHSHIDSFCIKVISKIHLLSRVFSWLA